MMKQVDSVFSKKIHIDNRIKILVLKIISGTSNSDKYIEELETLREFGKYPKTVKF